MPVTMDVETLFTEERPYLLIRKVTHAEFAAFALANPDLRCEHSAQGDLILMPPADAWGDSRNTEFNADLIIWNRRLPMPGIVFGQSAGFVLPNGATRSPDASWISAARWNALSPEERRGFAPICPDFVMEMLSPSDRLSETQRKMEEYLANGAALGFLIDRKNRTVYIYRPNTPVEVLHDTATLSGDPELPGFSLSLTHIF